MWKNILPIFVKIPILHSICIPGEDSLSTIKIISKTCSRNISVLFCRGQHKIRSDEVHGTNFKSALFLKSFLIFKAWICFLIAVQCLLYATMYDLHNSTDTLKFWTEKRAINNFVFVFHLILMKLGEFVVTHVYYNFTKFHQNRMKN